MSFLKRNKNIIILLLAMILSFVFFYSAKISCDNYFMFVHAKDILQNGFYPEHDILSMHKMPITYQKWLMCLIDYGLYVLKGDIALKIFHWIVFVGFIFVSYKLYLLNDDNKLRASFVVLAEAILMGLFETTRPQIFTYLFLTIELYVLEKYVKTGDKKNLYILPILSFFEIQIHSTNWPILICFVLPYVVLIPPKFNKLFVEEKYKIKPILFVMLLMILVALINPYGAESISYLIKSLFIKEIAEICGECNPNMFSTIFTSTLLVFCIMLFAYNKKVLQSRVVMLLAGTAILSFDAFRNFAFLIIVLPLIISLLNSNNYFVNIKHIKLLLFSFFIGLAFVFMMFYSSNIKSASHQTNIEKCANYLNEYSNENATFIANDEDITSYLAYISEGKMKPFIDNRLEVYSDKINDYHDYLGEFAHSGFINVINNYKIDYLIIDDDLFAKYKNYLLNDSTSFIKSIGGMSIIKYSWA